MKKLKLKGLDAVGSKNANSKLTDKNVLFIKKHKNKHKAAFFAQKYGVTVYTVYAIWAGNNWSHLNVD